MSERRADHHRIARTVPLFRDLAESELDAIFDVSRLFRVHPGSPLVREGDLGTGMYVLLEGAARATVRREGEPDVVFAELGPGDTVGELDLVDRGPHSGTVVSTETTTLLHVGHGGFADLRAAGHPAAFKVLRALAPRICQRLRDMDSRIDRLLADPERSARELDHASPQDAELDLLA